MKAALLLSLVLLIQSSFAAEVNPKCLYQSPEGDKYDLNPLAADDKDYMITYTAGSPPSTYVVYINVCRPVVTDLCSANPGAGACQTWNNAASNSRASLGLASSMVLGPVTSGQAGPDGKGLTAQFTQGTQDRQFEIDFICSPKGENEGQIAFIGENPTKHYSFNFKTIHACPVKGGGLSLGSILLITLLCVVVVYLVAGVLVKKFVMKVDGGPLEWIPNKDFWFGLPSLVKDGVMFLVGKVTKRGNYTQV